MRMKLTAAAVGRLKLSPGKSDDLIFDSAIHGFAVRLREGGHRSYIFQYKHGSRTRRLTIGSATAVDFGAAYKTAKTLYAQVRLGHDPAGEKEQARRTAGETFEAIVAEQYLPHKRRELRPQSYEDVERHLLRHAKPLHRLRLETVSRRDIAACLAAVRANIGRVSGNRTRNSLSALFSWAMSEGLVEANPVAGTLRVEEKSRERVLGLDELRLIWNALPDSHFGSIMRLLALTGARANEIAGLRCEELRDDAILLPGSRTKNGREHLIHLSAPASAILAATLGQRKDEERRLVFGRRTGPFSGWSKCKQALDQRIAEAAGKPLAPWRVHDLRRSFATHAAEIGIQPHIIEACLNHVSGHKGGVAGIYNKATYEPEKRTAFDRWAEHLLAVVEGPRSRRCAAQAGIAPCRAGSYRKKGVR
jgi:integrase